MEAKVNNIITSILNPVNRIAANAVYTLKQLSLYEQTMKNMYKLDSADDMNKAFHQLETFVRYAGELGSDSAEKARTYLQDTLNLNADTMKELFKRSNWDALKTVGFGLPFIHSSEKVAYAVYEVPRIKEGKRTYTKHKEKHYNVIENAPEIKKRTTRSPHTRDFSKKYNHVISELTRIDARVNPDMHYIIYDCKGEAPMMMVKVDDAHIGKNINSHQEDGYRNAIRLKYTTLTDCNNPDIRVVSMKAYQNGIYRRIAKRYNRTASSMPGIKKGEK